MHGDLLRQYPKSIELMTDSEQAQIIQPDHTAPKRHERSLTGAAG